MTEKRPNLTAGELRAMLGQLPKTAAVLIEHPAAGTLHDAKAYIVEDMGPNGPAFLCLELLPDAKVRRR